MKNKFKTKQINAGNKSNVKLKESKPNLRGEADGKGRAGARPRSGSFRFGFGQRLGRLGLFRLRFGSARAGLESGWAQTRLRCAPLHSVSGSAQLVLAFGSGRHSPRLAEAAPCPARAHSGRRPARGWRAAAQARWGGSGGSAPAGSLGPPRYPRPPPAARPP